MKQRLLSFLGSSILLIFYISFGCNTTFGQEVNDFYWLEKKPKELPVRVRGNLSTGKILLFIQGGLGEHGIDFATIDYWGLKKTLEPNIAIAYYDQRGLHKPKRKLKKEQITLKQYSKDIQSLILSLKKRYDADIWLMGHGV